MRQIEDFMNWLTDMDWGWWPFVSLRPPRDRDMDNRFLLKLSPLVGGITTLIFLVYLNLQHRTSFTVARVAAIFLSFSVACFVIYKLTFAYFWNRRARRLRDGQAQQQAMA
jgi:hypothetical protein